MPRWVPVPRTIGSTTADWDAIMINVYLQFLLQLFDTSPISGEGSWLDGKSDPASSVFESHAGRYGHYGS